MYVTVYESIQYMIFVRLDMFSITFHKRTPIDAKKNILSRTYFCIAFPTRFTYVLYST